MKKLMTVLLITFGCFTLVGCGDKENNGTNDGGKVVGQTWPTDISYVPNIPYDGKGTIVDQKEDTSYESGQYMIYIKGADLESANAYVDKLYSNGYEILNMFRESGKYLEAPKKGNYNKRGYENEDGTIKVVVVLHDGNDKYDLVITFADMSE